MVHGQETGKRYYRLNIVLITQMPQPVSAGCRALSRESMPAKSTGIETHR